MATERQLPWEDLADRLAQGFNGLLATPIQWPPVSPPKLPFDLDPGDIGGRIGQASADLSASVAGVVQHLVRQLPPPFFRPEDLLRIPAALPHGGGGKGNASGRRAEVSVAVSERKRRRSGVGFEADVDEDEELFGISGAFRKPKGTVNVTVTYDSRNQETESFLVARGDLWRVEASRGGSTSGTESTPLFLIQLGPLLFVRDSTLLLPVHLSKQHLLWYGYDRKNGTHSLCPAIWSKHRRWLLMSMVCINPLACSFMDLQFPNGQLTYVAGEGLAASAFLPIFGGLLQARGRYPGEARVSFSCKNKHGTRFAPVLQLPDKSLSIGVTQPIAWKRSGLMVRPSIQLSVCPTFGGSNPGIRTEVVHTLQEELNVACGFSCSRHSTAFTSLSLGRSKWNGDVGSSGIVMSLETPINNMGRPFFSIQLNGGFEF